MKSVYNVAENAELISRINLLNQESAALWGKMSVAQMMAHLQAPLNVAFGELNLKQSFIGILFGGYVKKKLAGDLPFGKNLPTVQQFVKNAPHNFEIEKQNLIKLIQRLAEKGSSSIIVYQHPFFGKMNAEEWDCLLYKHIDHHLQQFGV